MTIIKMSRNKNVRLYEATCKSFQEKKELTRKYRNEKILKEIDYFIYFTRLHTCNRLIINVYKIVHFCYTRMYNLI